MEDYPAASDRLSPVKQAIVELRALRTKLKAAERVRNQPIAIIGMGCRFPGADDPPSLWQMLCNSTDAIREVPPDRWNVDEFFDSNPDAPGKISTRWAGLLDEVDKFDAEFFGISPREAIGMDPQQRLFLEVAWEALENGGQSPEKLLGSDTGVFVGIASNDYAQLQLQFGDATEIDAYFATGTCHSVAAGRFSYTLGLQGPSVAIDTACSSSLVAVHLACQSLRFGECRVALAGGVNVILAPELLINFSKSHMMATDGRCKTFDASGDGFVRGEGCGVVVLKRLIDAVADGDNIQAVIRGTAVNQDGRSSGLTVPNGSSQQEVIRKALVNAGVDPSEVGYVETHGTGTSLGDPIEVHAVNAVYAKGRSMLHPLALGSIKTNIGHLETAAGVAGILKTVLILQHGEIPPHLHLKNLNPQIPWSEFPLSVPTSQTPWLPESDRRIAGVSSFGFSGTNAHLIVESSSGIPKLLSSIGKEERAQECEVQSLPDRSHHLLTLSGKNAEAVRELADRYVRHLGNHPEMALSDVCHTANTGRSHFEYRLAAIATSREQMRQILESGASGESPVGLLRGHADLSRRPEVVFLFTGQGGQYLQMGRALYDTEPIFRDTVDRCAALVKPYLEKPLQQVLYPMADEASPLNETQYTQVAMFAVQYGLAQLWRSWGVEPAAVMGHSVGEIVAATVAGGMSLEDGLMLMRERGRLMQSLPRTGMMASLMAGEADVAPVVERYRDRVAIAAINGPESTVISGESVAVQQVLQELESRGIKCKPLNVSNSFHSPLVEPVLEEFAAAARRIQYHALQMAQFSSMRLEWVNRERMLDADYWPYNLRNTVRFSQALLTLYEQGHRIFLEIGPSPTLVGMGSQCVPPGQGVWLPSLRAERNDWEQMLESLGTLYVNGVNIDWKQFDAHQSRKKLILPTYPFQRKPYWARAAKTRQRQCSSTETLHWQSAVAAARAQSHQVPIDLNLSGYVDKWNLLDRMAIDSMASTLFQLGAFRAPNETHSVDSLVREFRIQPAYRVVISHWFKKLAAEGVLLEAGDVYSSPNRLGEHPLDSYRLAKELADVPFLVDYMTRCGQMAPAILRGEASPLETLFPRGSLTLAEQIYEQWAHSRYFSSIAKSACAGLLKTSRPGRPLRILEIGAGTGGTTSAVLPVLQPDTLYYFTDMSPFFFDHARTKFRDYPSVRFGVLDIQKDPSAQGFGEHGFDVVLACNVLHTTRDLNETMNNVLRLLAPGALLVVCEVTNAPSWIEFSYGLIENWHNFSDPMRSDSPLLSVQQWDQLLRAHGFEEVTAFPEPGSPAEVLGEHCILARAPANATAGGKISAGVSYMQAAEALADAGYADVAKPTGESFVEKLRQAPESEQRELLVELVRDCIMGVLRRERSNPIDGRQRLMDIGFDSLMAVELRNRLGMELGLARDLPATLIFDYPSVEAIAEHLTDVLRIDHRTSRDTSLHSRQNAVESTGKDNQTLAIESLSDAEVEKLLLDKLQAM